jgi:polysaccharide biosynthesis/export protein
MLTVSRVSRARLCASAALVAAGAALSGCVGADPNAGPGAGSAGLAAQAPVTQPTVQPTAFAPPAASGGSASLSNSDYLISPQDILEISVYQAPTLSRSVQVDGTGRIVMPLIGAVEAGGKSAPQVEKIIAGKLGAKFMQSPQVSVFVKEAVGQRVTIEGAVKKPGVISLKGPTTLLQALALAEGTNDVADIGSVTVSRTSGQQRVSQKYDVTAIREGRAGDPQVFGGDTISVDESAGRNAWKIFKDAIPLVTGVSTRL